MSELQFRTTNRRGDRIPLDHGRASPGAWLIFAGVALSVVALVMVLGSAPPQDAGAPPASAVVPELAPSLGE